MQTGYLLLDRNAPSVKWFSDSASIHISEDYVCKRVLLHEFGHYFDYVMDYPSQSDEWAQIVAEEGFRCTTNRYYSTSGDIYSTYYLDPSEFFAECFRYHCENADYEFENCPKVQAYILRLSYKTIIAEIPFLKQNNL